jgi:hypothetical protein
MIALYVIALMASIDSEGVGDWPYLSSAFPYFSRSLLAMSDILSNEFALCGDDQEAYLDSY